jgi:hypothetical protein
MVAVGLNVFHDGQVAVLSRMVKTASGAAEIVMWLYSTLAGLKSDAVRARRGAGAISYDISRSSRR